MDPTSKCWSNSRRLAKGRIGIGIVGVHSPTRSTVAKQRRKPAVGRCIRIQTSIVWGAMTIAAPICLLLRGVAERARNQVLLDALGEQIKACAPYAGLGAPGGTI